MYFKGLFLISLLFLFSCEIDKTQMTKATDGNASNTINIAVFDGNGAGTVSVVETIEALRIDTGITAHALSAWQIQNGELSNYDAIIIPGGSGSKQLLNLGEQAQKKVHEFVNNGGGIIGICAGAYMLSSTKGYPNLHLATSVHIDRAHYNRGRGLVEFGLTEEGYKIFPELKNTSSLVQYYDGPVLVQGDSSNQYNELAQFVTDIHPDNFAPENITPGRTFILNESYGKGKVFLIAGHPESTPGMRWMVPRMARWVSNNDAISYDEHWVRPQLNDSAILFDKANRKVEKGLFWNLSDDDENVQIAAMHKLNELRSRPAVRWNMGMLRSNSKNVRLTAAKLLYETEYTAAIDDVKQALSVESDDEVKVYLNKFIDSYNDSY